MLHSMLVRDYMEASLVTFKPEQAVLDAIRLLLEQGISSAPVLDRLGNICGILSEKDCLRVALETGYHGESGGTVGEYMSTGVITVDLESSILEVAKMFLKASHKRYPVLSDNRLVGVITRHDVLRAIEHISQENTLP